MELTINQFYEIGKKAVRLYSANPGERHLQPQAWRVLQRDRGTDISTENLGVVQSDKDAPFFWSRQWMLNKYRPATVAFDYPLVTAYEVNFTDKGLPMAGGVRRDYVLELAVWDVYSEGCGDERGRKGDTRSINQIFADTDTILNNVLAFYRDQVLATTSKDPVERIYYLPWLKKQMELGNITRYNVAYSLAATLAGKNPSVSYSRVERPVQHLYGTKARIIFSTSNCPSPSFDLSAADYGVLAFEAGCQDCE